MKKLLYSFCIISLVATAPGCKKFLDQKPLSEVPQEEFFKSAKDINTAMAGIYASWQQEMTGDGDNFTGKYFLWGELRSDNFEYNGQYAGTSVRELAQNALTSGNSSSNWTGFYRTIGRCNTAIKFIPQAASYDANATPTFVNNNLAQAYAMRALSYFYIIRIWGDAVVWTEPYTDVSQPDQKPRTAKEEVLKTVIIPDLEKAYSLIQKSQTPSVWTIGEAAIAAILADVYMWRSHDDKILPDYTKAITWINNVFKAKAPTGKVYNGTSASDLEATADWKKNLFLNPAASKEAIWSIHWDNTTNGCACQPVSIGNSNTQGRIDSVIHADWKKTKADIRPGQTIDTLTGLGHNDRLIKYYNVNGQFPSGSSAPQATTYNVYLVMYRLADVMLLYAEALNKTGDMTTALKYLNFIRQRAGLTAYLATDPAVSTSTALENTILTERRLELFGEGKRWFDLVRTDKVFEVMNPTLSLRQARWGIPETGFGSDKNKILWPLHRTVLEDNKVLKQNLSYN